MSDFQQKALKHLGLDSTNPNFSITDSDMWDLSNIQAGYNICKKEYEEKPFWTQVSELLPEIEKGEAYSERFLLKCEIFKSTKTFICVRDKYGEFIVEGMKSEILDPHYKPVEWRYFL